MRRTNTLKPGYGKILDAWIPPEDAGDSVGCVATSFTFSPTLFEEECLGRFLQLETDAVEDGPAFLIEREEKLSQLMCAAALVDQHHARGVRNLRWDLLAARLPRDFGNLPILHAKVSVLFWSRCIRLIVGSANLTPDGYRRNHEIFAAFDYREGGESPLPVLDAIIAFLRNAANYAQAAGPTDSPAIRRWNNFLDRVSGVSRSWGITVPARTLAKPHVFAVLTGLDRPSALATVREQWPDNSPPDAAFVVSPFFDRSEATNVPVKELWRLLKQRGEATVEFEVTAEEVLGEKAILLHAPKSLQEAQPANRSQVTTTFTRLKLEEGRPLHAKCLWLQNERLVLHMIGSSNFTSAGLGIGQTKNLEANLAFAVNRKKGEARRALEAAWLPVEEIPDDIELRWQPLDDEGEDSPSDLQLLPMAFGTAMLGRDTDGGSWIEFGFTSKPPPGWSLFAEEDSEPFVTEAVWLTQGEINPFRVTWDRERAPSGFRVNWSGAAGFAWWQVNVVSNNALPPPCELRNLPLEVLIEILTSAKPLHHTLARWLKRRSIGIQSNDLPSLDPHQRVDTSTFLLQRTRRVSWAFTALRQRLERPVASEPALVWRLRGPVGVHAFAQAIGKEARSESERCFLLTELCLELARVRPEETRGSLAKSRVSAAIRELIRELRSEISLSALSDQPALAAYAKTVFEELPA